MSKPPGSANETFIVTKEYRRFAEFCDACRRYRYIGICYGPPGVGKTRSARHYADWDQLKPVLQRQRTALAPPSVAAAAECHSLLYTPTITTTPKQLAEDLQGLRWDLTLAADRASDPDDEQQPPLAGLPDPTELILVEEADRLKLPALEQLRDIYDRRAISVILIGMPGLEKRLARYAQLYSRVGFVHHFRPLSTDEMHFILAHKWQHLGLSCAPDDFTDAEAMAAVIRITGGNFRLIQRLFTQIERILQVNALQTITKEVVEAAREQLVIGPI
jgi:DNA transposition AAA+ family ATPase